MALQMHKYLSSSYTNKLVILFEHHSSQKRHMSSAVHVSSEGLGKHWRGNSEQL